MRQVKIKNLIACFIYIDSSFIKKEMANISKRNEALRTLLEKLPSCNRILLSKLFKLFQLVASYSALNMMNPAQLSKYLAPCFMIEVASNEAILEIEPPLKKLIQLFIEEFELFFFNLI